MSMFIIIESPGKKIAPQCLETAQHRTRYALDALWRVRRDHRRGAKTKIECRHEPNFIHVSRVRVEGANTMHTASAKFGDRAPSGALLTITRPALFNLNVGWLNSMTNCVSSGSCESMEMR